MTSAASVTSVAPCLIRSLAPAARGSSGEPGTANTSRPCSAAIRAVISDPERCAASTTTTPSAAPEISRLRRGKSCARGTWPSGISEIARALFEQGGEQVFVLGRIDPVMPAGQHRDGSAGEAGAMRRLVDAAREPRDDDKSGIGKIVRQRAANFNPAPDALREPTIAIIGRISASMRAAHAEQWRCVVDGGEPWRIASFLRCDQR